MVVTTLNDHQQPFPTRHIQNTRNESMRGFCHQTLYASLLTWLGHLATWELELGAFLYVSFCEAHASTCLSFYRPTFLSTCVSIYILVCFRIYLSIYLSFFLSFFLSVFLSFFLSFFPSFCLSTYIYLCICNRRNQTNITSKAKQTHPNQYCCTLSPPAMETLSSCSSWASCEASRPRAACDELRPDLIVTCLHTFFDLLAIISPKDPRIYIYIYRHFVI